MIKLFNACCHNVANSSDICLVTKNTIRTISSNDFLDLILLERSIKGLSI